MSDAQRHLVWKAPSLFRFITKNIIPYSRGIHRSTFLWKVWKRYRRSYRTHTSHTRYTIPGTTTLKTALICANQKIRVVSILVTNISFSLRFTARLAKTVSIRTIPGMFIVLGKRNSQIWNEMQALTVIILAICGLFSRFDPPSDWP